MKKFTHLRQLAGTLALLACCSTAQAIERPAISQTPVEGEKYMLINYARPSFYWTRTSWDGAYMVMPYENWKNNTDAWKPLDFMVKTDDEGIVYLYYETLEPNAEEEEGDSVTVAHYLTIPYGGGNLKGGATDPAGWELLPGDYEGFYKLKATQGHGNEQTIGHLLHLNAGGEYVQIYYPDTPWGLDIYGGVVYDENGDIVYENEEEMYPFFGNTDQTNWAFIREADIPAYNEKIVVWEAVKEIEENYQDEYPDFTEGFKLAVEAASAIYDNPQGNLSDAIALLEAKKSLFNKILETVETNEEEDPALTAAIDKAIAQFNSSVSVEEAEQTAADLDEAIKNYFGQSGDFTHHGTNMSFEDLSAQNGSQNNGGTSNAPFGWNIYINGQPVNSADEIKAAGLTGWCGVNADASGSMEGTVVFGIWNTTIPEFEISQTIEGLENGLYYLSAAMMVGANGSGSRMTTQRIFGNLNSVLFGHESDYNSSYLNPAEVYTYAGCDEPYTDTELQEMGVDVFVYDGTLTFGLRTNGEWRAVSSRTGSNGAGGDGWFKLDNFRITRIGDGEGLAEDMLSYFINQIVEYSSEQMQLAVQQEADRLCNLSPSNIEETTAALLAARDFIGTIKASVEAYAGMNAYLEECTYNIELYADYAGIEAYTQAVYDADDQVYTCELDAGGLAQLRASLEQALTDLMLSGVAVGKDVTDLLSNPGFEDLRNTSVPYGWNLVIDGKSCTTSADVAGIAWCGINGGDNISVTDENGDFHDHQPTEGSNLFGIWTSTIPDVELSQTLTGLPSGTYTLTADVMVQWNWAGDCLTTQRIFANDAVCMFGAPQDYIYNATPDMLVAMEADRAAGFYVEADDYIEADDEAPAAAAGDDEIDAYRLMNYGRYNYQSDPIFDLLHTLTLKFVVGENGVAKIGFRTNNVNRDGNAVNNGIGWFKVDNFTLFYESRDIPTAIENAQGAAPATLKVDFYRLDGVRLAAPQRGVNIAVSTLADGSKKVQKVWVK